MKRIFNYIYDYSKRSILLQVAVSLLVLHIVFLGFAGIFLAIAFYGEIVWIVSVISALTFIVWKILYDTIGESTPEK